MYLSCPNVPHTCEPTLSGCISWGEIKTSLDFLHTRMQAMTQLESENLKITKINVSQPPKPVPTQDLTVVSEIKAAADRIDAFVKSKQNRSKLRKML